MLNIEISLNAFHTVRLHFEVVVHPHEVENDVGELERHGQGEAGVGSADLGPYTRYAASAAVNEAPKKSIRTLIHRLRLNDIRDSRV